MARVPRGPGLVATVRRMFATLLLILRSRLELVSVEVEEQLVYAANLLVWTLVAIFCASLGILFLAITVLILCWDRYRLVAAGGITLTLMLMAIGAVVVVRSRLRQRPQFLVATISELSHDSAAAIPDE